MASERHYGLALALGGGEVTMEEAATLYAMLANDGRLRPLRHRVDELVRYRNPVALEQASFMTIQMLEQNPRPNDSGVVAPRGRSRGVEDRHLRGDFAMLSGRGARVGHYVLAVWVGNFDGSSNRLWSAPRRRAPLFFRLIDGLRVSEPGAGRHRSAAASRRHACGRVRGIRGSPRMRTVRKPLPRGSSPASHRSA